MATFDRDTSHMLCPGATASLYSPDTGQAFGTLGASGKKTIGRDGVYLRCYTLLKAQRTVLSSTEREIKDYAGESGPIDDSVKKEILDVLQLVLSARLCQVCTQTTDTGISKIREVLGRSELQPIARKWALRTMVSLLSIKKAAERFVITAILQNSEGRDTSQRSCLVQSPTDELATQVCRICDEHIPTQLFEEHVENCIEAYRSESKLSQVDAKLNGIVTRMANEELNVEWPGLRLIALESTMPLFQIWFLYWQCLSLDPRTSEGCDALKLAAGFVNNILSNESFSKNQFVRDGAALIIEKSRRSIVLNYAANVLRQTTLSGRDVFRRETRISDFAFVKNISSGAFARVFMARKKKTGDLYAIKVLPKADATQKNKVRRIFTERDILLTLNSQFIVNFYYSIIGKNNLYLVMEFCPGGDLFCMLQELGSFDEPTAKLYTYEVVQALKFLRSHGIIHHDLKPDNILVSSSGSLKLTDFGLSHLGFVGREATSDGVTSEMAVGTPDYTAPEVILNQQHTYSADYWSLGAMIYEFLTGMPPFHGKTKEETYANILAGNVDYHGLEDTSDEARDLIKKLLVSTPEARIGASDIDEILNHPWLKDVNPSHAKPFVPDVKNEEDTDYFDSRSGMDFDETDILEDMDYQGSEEDVPDGDQMKEFQSVSVEQLVKKNEQVVARIHRASCGEALSPRLDLEALMGDSSPRSTATLRGSASQVARSRNECDLLK